MGATTSAPASDLFMRLQSTSITTCTDIPLMEAFASSTERASVVEHAIGSGHYLDMLCLVAEQAGYSGAANSKVEAFITELESRARDDAGKRRVRDRGDIQRYLLRRRLVTYSGGGSSEDKALLDSLIRALGPSLAHSAPRVESDATSPSAAAAVAASTPRSAAAAAAAARLDVPSTDALLSAAIKAGERDLKQYDSHDWMRYVKQAVFTQEHPVVLRAAQANDASTYHYLTSLEAVPDLGDAAVTMVRHMLGNKKYKHQYASWLPHLNLKQLRALKGFFASWSDDLEEMWLREVVARTAPPRHVDLRVDMPALAAYCDDVWAVLKSTSMAAHTANSMRALVAFHRMRVAYMREKSFTHSACLGALKDFLEIPLHSAPWTKHDATGIISSISTNMWLRNAGDAHSLNSTNELALLGVTYDQLTRTVKAAFMDIFAADTHVRASDTGSRGLSPWDAYCSTNWLRSVAAEAKILTGLPATEATAWTTHLLETSLPALRDRVLLTFAESNPEYFRAADDVTISFTVQGIKAVSVLVYEVNTTAYYTDNKAEIASDIDLDGLAPHERTEVDLTHGSTASFSPLKQHNINARIPSLCGHRRGVYVVELVGGGISCRALIRKGALRLIERRTVAGHALTVCDEENTPLPPSRISVCMDARSFAPHPSSGEIVIPYGTSARRVPLMLTLRDDVDSVTSSSSESGGSSIAGWTFTTLMPGWQHTTESYTLEAAFHVDREALVKDNYSASLAVRPRLLLHGVVSAPLPALMNVCLTVTATDAEGNASTRVMRDFTLYDDRESMCTFAVPPEMRTLSAVLTAEVRILAGGHTQSLSASTEWSINGINAASATQDGHLRYSAREGGFVFLLCGKTGEPIAGARLTFTLHHCLTSYTHNTSGTTDEAGRIVLGELEEYARVVVNGGGLTSAAFTLPRETNTYPTHIHTTSAGDGGAFDVAAGVVAARARAVQAVLPFRPACMRASSITHAQPPPRVYNISRHDISLVEVRPRPHGSSSVQLSGEDVTADTIPVTDMLSDDYITYDASACTLIIHDLPAGEYELVLKRPYARCVTPPPAIHIRVMSAHAAVCVAAHLAQGTSIVGCAPHAQPRTSADAMLSMNPAMSLQIASVESDTTHMSVRVTGGLPRDTRVHVYGTYFVPVWDAGAKLSSLSSATLSTARWGAPRSRYMNGRTLDEEYKYILDRATAGADAKRPGNLLPRPTLLLNPWSLGTVSTDVQDAKDGTAYAHTTDSAVRGFQAAQRNRAEQARDEDSSSHAVYECVDFLSLPGTSALNARVDEHGVARIGLASLRGRAQHDLFITIVAADGMHTASTFCTLCGTAASEASPFRDLTRAGGSLPVDGHFVHTNRIRTLTSPGDAAVVHSAGTFVKIEAFHSLDKLFRYFTSAAGDADLTKTWGWMLTWPRMSASDKLRAYAEHACHETHVFLFFKDAAFFNTYIRPYLACKRAKQFIDRWLLGEDVTCFATAHALCHLNAFELALLCMCSPPRVGAAIARVLRDRADAAPVTVTAREELFKAALAAEGLEEAAPSYAAPSEAMAPPPPPPSAPARMLTASFARPSAAAPVARASAAPMSKRMAAPSRRMEKQAKEEEAEAAPECDDDAADMPSMQMSRDVDMDMRESVSRVVMFRPVDKTEEFAESQWWKLRAADSSCDTVQAHELWADLAVYGASLTAANEGVIGDMAALSSALSATPFLSQHVHLIARRPLREVVLAMAVVSLAWELNDAAPPVRPTVAILDEGARVQFTNAGTPVLLFHQDLVRVAAPTTATVLVGQNYLDPANPHRMQDGVRTEAYLPMLEGARTAATTRSVEMLPGKVYAADIVVTNVTATSRTVEVFMQIPRGAMPASNGFFSSTKVMNLSAFTTQRVSYRFYFPRGGEYEHFPVHVGSDGVLLAHAAPVCVRVVQRLSSLDVSSWDVVSVRGSIGEVVAYMNSTSLAALDVSRILWRCTRVEEWQAIIDTLAAHGVFHDGVWAYALKHGTSAARLREYLSRPAILSRLASQLGPAPVLVSPILTVRGEAAVGAGPEEAADADLVFSVDSRSGSDVGSVYEHLEYAPLINARAHTLGTKRAILNKAVERQYRSLLHVLCAKAPSAITDADKLAVVYHLLLQDRVAEAGRVFDTLTVPASSALASARTSATGSSSRPSWLALQYDYAAAYLDFFKSSSTSAAASARYPIAGQVAVAYRSYPVPKWAARFREIASQLLEAGVDVPAAGIAGVRVEGGALGTGTHAQDVDAAKDLTRESLHSRAQSSEPQLQLSMEDGEAVLTYANVASVQLRVYSMDLEMLFSTRAFDVAALTQTPAHGDSGTAHASLGAFAYVRPNRSLNVSLPVLPTGRVGTHRVRVHEHDSTGNVMVEAVVPHTALRRTCPYFATRLTVTVTPAFGRLAVTDVASKAPCACVYVKVYARVGGDVRFYKDGYTDVRGVFDYVSLSTDELTRTSAFAIYVCDDAGRGATVVAAKPPASSNKG